MEQLNPRARRDAYGSKLNRAHSPVLAYGMPWLTIAVCSLLPLLPIVALAPVVPPLAYMMLLGWRLMRPGLLPMWAGLPLGLVDDLFSGQPLGSAILLWSLTIIATELLELRFPWRSFWQDWTAAIVFILAYLLATAMVSGGRLDIVQFGLLIPQGLFAIIAFPIVAKMVSLFDRIRLKRVRRIG